MSGPKSSTSGCVTQSKRTENETQPLLLVPGTWKKELRSPAAAGSDHVRLPLLDISPALANPAAWCYAYVRWN